MKFGEDPVEKRLKLLTMKVLKVRTMKVDELKNMSPRLNYLYTDWHDGIVTYEAKRSEKRIFFWDN